MSENDINSEQITYSTSLPNIILTEFRDEDVPTLVEYLGQDTEIHNNLRYLPQPYTLDDAKGFIQWTRNLKKEYQRHVNLAIREKNTGKMVGSCGFDDSDLKTPTEVGLGYWLGKEHWGKGIGTAVVGTLTQIGFEKYGYKKLYADVFEWNLGSQKILLKNGFIKEKILENHIEKNGKLINCVKLSKTK
jgi:ribosomal-protein-alanine N-acetyltransferase